LVINRKPANLRNTELTSQNILNLFNKKLRIISPKNVYNIGQFEDVVYEDADLIIKQDG
jgi:hypothetical protein